MEFERNTIMKDLDFILAKAICSQYTFCKSFELYIFYLSYGYNSKFNLDINQMH
jgi:hypothetical protein